MHATANYGSMPERAQLALAAGCDMVLVCNDRNAARQTVSALNDYSNPLSLVRLARLHGTGHVMRETLLASEHWQRASAAVGQFSERPQLQLDA
jgi:beta-N-acetylhexosaminidase